MLPQRRTIIESEKQFMGPQQSDVRMFRTEIAPESSFLGWVIQQIAAPIPLVLWALLVSPLESSIAPWIGQSRNTFDFFLYLPVGWTLSLLLAIVVQGIFPGAAVCGRRIWVVPVCLLALAFCWEGVGFSFRQAFAILFYPDPDGESQWAFVLMTCPTVSAIAYSLGMIFSTRRR
jgi:hypothetical protein